VQDKPQLFVILRFISSLNISARGRTIEFLAPEQGQLRVWQTVYSTVIHQCFWCHDCKAEKGTHLY